MLYKVHAQRIENRENQIIIHKKHKHTHQEKQRNLAIKLKKTT